MFTYPDFSGINSNYYDKSLLLCFAKKGLFIYKGNTLQPLTGPANEFIKKNGIRCGSLLNDSTFAVGTLQKGAIVFNKNGEIIRLINNPWHKDDIVYSIIPDRVGGMWMAMQQGIDHVIGINAGYSLFDHILGLDGVVLALPSPIRHNGILYVSTTTGVYYLDKQQSRFYVVEGLSGSFWNLFEFNKSLFAVRGSIRKIDYNRTKLVKRLTEPAVSVHRSSVNPDKVYMGIKDGGLKILKMNKGKWIEDGRIKGIYETIRNMAEEKNGDLWLGIESDGVIHIRFSAYDKIPEIERYGTQQGLPPGRIYVYKTSLYPVFSTNRGLFKFNKMSAVLFPIQYSENLWPTVRE